MAEHTRKYTESQAVLIFRTGSGIFSNDHTPHPRRFTIGLIQMSVSDNSDENVRHATDMIREAAGKRSPRDMSPELFRTRYFCQHEEIALFDLAESVPGPTTASLGETAKTLGVVIIAPVFERRGTGMYHNSAGRDRRRRTDRRVVQENAHPRRSGVFRKVLFHPR